MSLFLFIGCDDTEKDNGGNPPEIKETPLDIIRQAYLFAMPIIYTDVTRISFSIPDNYLYTYQKLPDYTYTSVVAPNLDTNYSKAFLKLEDGPVMLEIPEIDRYYSYPIMDAWTNNFIIPGTRLTGSKIQKYFITCPDWEGEVPSEYEHIVSPTSFAYVNGRVRVINPEDLQENVIPIQNSVQLKSVNPPYTGERPSDKYLPKDFGGKSPVEIVKELSIENYLNYFNELLEVNPA